MAEPAPGGGSAGEASLVLRIDVEPGHTVAFHEPAPGGLYLVERMRPDQAFALDDRAASDALLAFERLRPGAPVPAALQAAYDRARALPSLESPRSLELGGGQPEVAEAPRPGVLEQALTSSSSAATFVNVNGGCKWGPQMSFCRVNWSGGYYAQWSSATSGLCIVDHYAGNGVTIQITVGSTISSSFQGAGTIAQYSLGAPGAATKRRLDITNASGDRFHAGCRWGV